MRDDSGKSKAGAVLRLAERDHEVQGGENGRRQ